MQLTHHFARTALHLQLDPDRPAGNIKVDAPKGFTEIVLAAMFDLMLLEDAGETILKLRLGSNDVSVLSYQVGKILEGPYGRHIPLFIESTGQQRTHCV